MIKLPPHKCSLTITHNEHKDSYNTVEQHLECSEFNDSEFTPEDRAKCIATNELWTLQWYPDRPIGARRVVAGPTLERVLARANGED